MLQSEWDWEYLSKHINIQEVINHPDKPWNRRALSENRGISLYVINTLSLIHGKRGWSSRYISECINIQEVLRYPHQRWDKRGLSYNKGITIEIIDLFDREYTHELRHLYYPKIQYRDNYLYDIDILCIENV